MDDLLYSLNSVLEKKQILNEIRESIDGILVQSSYKIYDKGDTPPNKSGICCAYKSGICCG